MRAFVLVSCCLALASARPEAGYSYNRPSTGGGSHGGGGGGGGYSSGGHGGGGGGGGGHGGASFSSGGGSGFSSFGGSGFGGSSSFSSGGASSFGGGASSFGGGASSFGGGASSFGGGGSSFGGGVSSFGGGGGGFSGGSQQAIIQKHIYVHVPPPEPEEVRVQRPLQVAPAQKHYKIIFIKAPSAPAYQAPQIPLQPQNEEKTLVYVLVKKPDDQQDIIIPTPAPTQPSKPEVYFIKYKTQKEAGQGGYSGNVGASFGADISGSVGGHDGGAGHGDDLSGGHGATAPAAQYGPPGKSGPY